MKTKKTRTTKVDHKDVEKSTEGVAPITTSKKVKKKNKGKATVVPRDNSDIKRLSSSSSKTTAKTKKSKKKPVANKTARWVVGGNVLRNDDDDDDGMPVLEPLVSDDDGTDTLVEEDTENNNKPASATQTTQSDKRKKLDVKPREFFLDYDDEFWRRSSSVVVVSESPEAAREDSSSGSADGSDDGGIYRMFPTTLSESISVTVKHWNGDSFRVESAPNDYIDDIRDSISDKKNIPPEELRVSFRGRPARDDMNLLEQGIVDGSVLTLEPMRVFFRLPVKRGITKLAPVVVALDQTIGSIKNTIAKRMMNGIDSRLLSVMFFGEALDGAATISECGVDHEDELKVEVFEIKVVHSPTGEMFSLDGLGPTSTTYDVKKRISESRKHPVPIKQQVLRVKGRVLHDVVRLKDQGVKHRGVIILDPLEEKAVSSVPKEKASLAVFKPAGSSARTRSARRRKRDSGSSSSTTTRSSMSSSSSSSRCSDKRHDGGDAPSTASSRSSRSDKNSCSGSSRTPKERKDKNDARTKKLTKKKKTSKQ